MKEIVFVINRLGGTGWGGAHRVTAILSNYFARKNYKVTLIVWERTEIKYPIDNKVKIEYLDINVTNSKKRIQACLETRKRIKEKKGAWVIVLMSRMAVDIYWFTRFQKIKFLGAERTDPRSEPKTKIKRLFRNFSFCFMNKIVFQTEDAKKYFPKIAQKKSIVIPNPISPNLIKEYHGEREKNFVTFCRIDKQKNLYMMIDAFIISHKSHPEFKLEIYGNGIIEKEIKEYIRSSNAEDFIKMYDFCTNIHEKIIKKYAFLSSSDYEGISNSMLEAMAIGLPCICTDCPCGGAKMIIQDGINGILVPVKNAQIMSGKINELIENKELADKLSINASKIREELNQELICKKWEEFINNGN